ncbi:MAG: DUF5615 family PIN-like protein [Thermoplasmata archaeon]
MAPPRYLADEMLGRLARYLRFVGCDTLYLRGLSDDEILARARGEDRVVLTRDRDLARRAPRGFLIGSPHLREQWSAVRAEWPDLATELRFERCSLCNGLLAPYRMGTDPAREEGLPRDRVERGLEVWGCDECGHLYWEGTHTARIRSQFALWSAEGTR